MERQFPDHTITNYVAVPSVDRLRRRSRNLAAKSAWTKTAVPQMGYFVVCNDTENNQFALWEPDEKRKIVVLKGIVRSSSGLKTETKSQKQKYEHRNNYR